MSAWLVKISRVWSTPPGHSVLPSTMLGRGFGWNRSLTARPAHRFNLSGMSMHPQPVRLSRHNDSANVEGSSGHEQRRHGRRLAHRTPHTYRLCDRFTEILLYGMIVFSPWAFGSTQPWAVWVMNIAGYALGILLAVKWGVCRLANYAPPRWGDAGNARWPVRLLAGLTVALLGWCLVSALNARATIDLNTIEFAYRESYINWLPHSYHAAGSWFEFWKYLGLACTFWALRDWLLGQTRRERLREQRDQSEPADPFEDLPPEPGTRIPARLRRFLWFVCLNGTLLAAEGILQRLDGTSKLLWLVEPLVNKTSEGQFGPYAYRSNAAQYLNLIWPVCLGLWWTLRRESHRALPSTRRLGGSPHLVLLPCAALVAAAPLLSMSRGGVLITAVTAPLAVLILYLAARRHRAHWSWLVPIAAGAVLAAVMAAAWPLVKPRLYGPRKVYPIRPGLALDQFTLRCAFRVPTDTSKIGWGLVTGLAGYEIGWYGIPPATAFMMRPSGGFNLIFFGPDGASQELPLLTNLLAQYRGEVIDITVTRESLPRLFINGAPIPLPDPSRMPPMATNAVAGSYLRVEPQSAFFDGLPAVVSAWDVALSATEIAALHDEFKQGNVSIAKDDRFTRPLVEVAHDEIRAPAFLLDQMSGRRETYATAEKMLKDFVWLGSGPGTFGALYGPYRSSTRDYWTWWAHNDWLEFRITFGRIGLGLALLALATAMIAPLQTGGVPLPRALPATLWVGMAGCLAHARFDFPFQIHSVALMFLVLACLCTIVSRR